MKTVDYSWLVELEAFFLAAGDVYPVIAGEVCRDLIAGVYPSIVWC